MTAGAETNDTTLEGGGVGGFFATANPRTGGRHFRSNIATPGRFTFAGVNATTYYARVYVYLNQLPVSEYALLGFGEGSSERVHVILLSNGTFILRNVTTQVGSPSSPISAGVYFMLELAYKIDTGATDYLEARLNGVSFASGTGLSITDTLPTSFFHVHGTTEAGVTTDTDDVALNDSTGAAQNSWPGEGNVVLLAPISDSAGGTGWTLGTGTALGGNGFAAVDNTPPVGVADLAVGSDPKQIRNASSNANVNYDANLTTYTNAGIATGATINVVVPFVSTSAPVVTSAKAGTIGVASNPAITNVALGAAGTAGAFWQGVAGGTYPTGWKLSYGTTTYAPTVTLGTSPVIRITQVTASTRIAVVCALGMYVDYTPAATPAVKKPPHKNQVAVMRPVLR